MKGSCWWLVASKRPKKGATMFMSREELLEEIECHIRRFGGRFGEWSIGTAKGGGKGVRRKGCHQEERVSGTL